MAEPNPLLFESLFCKLFPVWTYMLPRPDPPMNMPAPSMHPLKTILHIPNLFSVLVLLKNVLSDIYIKVWIIFDDAAAERNISSIMNLSKVN